MKRKRATSAILSTIKFKKRNKKGPINSYGSSGQESQTKAGSVGRGFRNCPHNHLASEWSLAEPMVLERQGLSSCCFCDFSNITHCLRSRLCERLRGTRGWTPELDQLQSSGKLLTSWVPRFPHLSRGVITVTTSLGPCKDWSSA